MVAVDLLSIHRHRHMRGSSRSTVDTVVGEPSCDQLLRRLQLSPLPSTEATAASTDTGTRVAALILYPAIEPAEMAGSDLYEALG